MVLLASVTSINSQQDVYKSLLGQSEPTWDIPDISLTRHVNRNCKPSFTYVHASHVVDIARRCVRGEMRALPMQLPRGSQAAVSDNRSGSVLLLLLLSSRQALLPSVFTFHFRRTDRRTSLYRSRTSPKGAFRVRTTVMLTVYIDAISTMFSISSYFLIY